MNILIVDDEKEIADLLQLYLEGGDFHTFAAAPWAKRAPCWAENPSTWRC